jgi:hypothetical protein
MAFPSVAFLNKVANEKKHNNIASFEPLTHINTNVHGMRHMLRRVLRPSQ